MCCNSIEQAIKQKYGNVLYDLPVWSPAVLTGGVYVLNIDFENAGVSGIQSSLLFIKLIGSGNTITLKDNFDTTLISITDNVQTVQTLPFQYVWNGSRIKLYTDDANTQYAVCYQRFRINNEKKDC